MCRRLHKLLLILITLAVAAGPLRGAWALPGTSIHAGNCAGMQHAMQPMKHAGYGTMTDAGPHKCKSGCNGTCCERNCTVCLHHATAAIAAGVPILRAASVRVYGLSATGSFPERPPTPPLRPPLSLQV